MIKSGMTIGIINIFLIINSYGQFEATMDLNNDGKIDSILANETEDSYGYILSVNDVSITARFNDGDLDKLEIVDINKWDNYKEIVVHSPGPSNDDEYMIYWYNGYEIRLVDHLSRWPEFRGNGIIYVDNWEGFWKSRDKYVLDNTTRKLNHVKQFAYYVGAELEIGDGFEIYQEKELVNKVALLADSSIIQVILCAKDNLDFFDYRFLIKSSSGLLGWIDLKTINDSKPIPMAD